MNSANSAENIDKKIIMSRTNMLNYERFGEKNVLIKITPIDNQG